ncbi:hypothetical protein GCM10007880_61560 [Mesorhizobium amorphae]|nr:hypothetical protein GCM10007880_61560 [Mesorhizobium amorphae]
MDCRLAEEVRLKLIAPRFMTDQELRAFFGLSERALYRLRFTRQFPTKDPLINKTDRRAVDIFFDRRARISPTRLDDGHGAVVDREGNFDTP